MRDADPHEYVISHGSAIVLACVMAYDYPHELRRKAEHQRYLAAFGEDEHLKAALLELAEEFDQEAARIEARSKDGAISWVSALNSRNAFRTDVKRDANGS
jgi:hypothetical protein